MANLVEQQTIKARIGFGTVIIDFPLHDRIAKGKDANQEDVVGAVVEGDTQNNIARGVNSHSEGSGAKAYGLRSHAEGYNTTAGSSLTASAGTNAHAEGQGSSAAGQAAHSEGASTMASGNYAHSEGNGTIASDLSAHAEGIASVASGEASHSEGNSSTALGDAAHSEGDFTVASGDNSHAEGSNTTAYGRSQHVFGELNIPDPVGSSYMKGTYVEIVGNGENGITSNARTLDWEGNEKIAGSLTIGMDTENEVTITPAQLTALLALLD